MNLTGEIIMSSSTNQLMSYFKDPIKEIETIREGINPELIESFLNDQSFVVKDVLGRLKITASTYFAKKKMHKLLDSSTTEKFLRLFAVVQNAKEILGGKEAKNWLYRKIPSLGDQMPMDLLDTEAGHRLVEQALLQIKYGIYS
jgi:putative toxin-antitoxin system antitoxin component (TIGR02293 family)